MCRYIANKTFFSVLSILERNDVHPRTKIRIRVYKTVILPALLYGSEAWTPSQIVTNIARLQVLTAASMRFRIVFWDVLPRKIIVTDCAMCTPAS
jgi:hypothetical protein